MSELFDSAFLNKIQRLVISSKMVVTGGMGGNRKSKSKGSSVEFSDYREYSAGDDFRRIDWNAYARFEKLFIKLFMEEREAPVNIFLDTSSSMDWGEPAKSWASRRLAAALGYIALSNYDRLSVFSFSDKIDDFRLSIRGVKSFSNLLDFLKNIKYSGETSLLDCVKKSRVKNDKGISFIISDLFSQQSLEETARFLRYKKQQVYVCHVLSPQELTPQHETGIRVVDIETGKHRDINITSDFMKAYFRARDSFLYRNENECISQGAQYMVYDTSVPVEGIIRQVVGQ